MAQVLFTLVDVRGFSHHFLNHAILYESPMLRRFLSFKHQGAEPDNVTRYTLALDPEQTQHMLGMDEVLEIVGQMEPRPQLKYPWHQDRRDWTEEMMNDIDPEATSWDTLFERQDRALRKELAAKMAVFSAEVIKEMAIVCSPKWLDIPILMAACMQRSYETCKEAPMGVYLYSLEPFEAFQTMAKPPASGQRPRDATDENEEPTAKRAV